MHCAWLCCPRLHRVASGTPLPFSLTQLNLSCPHPLPRKCFSLLARTGMDSIWRQCDVLRWLRSSCDGPNPALFLSIAQPTFPGLRAENSSIRQCSSNMYELNCHRLHRVPARDTPFHVTPLRVCKLLPEPTYTLTRRTPVMTSAGSMVPPITPNTRLFQYSSS